MALTTVQPIDAGIRRLEAELKLVQKRAAEVLKAALEKAAKRAEPEGLGAREVRTGEQPVVANAGGSQRAWQCPQATIPTGNGSYLPANSRPLA